MINLLEHLQTSLHSDSLVNSLQGSYSKVLSEYELQIDILLNQMFIETSTISLEFWERMLQINNFSDDLEERRSVILRKIRSRRTTTIEALKDYIKLYINCEVDIEKHYHEYYIIINITEYYSGLNIFQINNVIKEVIPAHINFHINAFSKLKDALIHTSLTVNEIKKNVVPVDDDKAFTRLSIKSKITFDEHKKYVIPCEDFDGVDRIIDIVNKKYNVLYATINTEYNLERD